MYSSFLSFVLVHEGGAYHNAVSLYQFIHLRYRELLSRYTDEPPREIIVRYKASVNLFDYR